MTVLFESHPIPDSLPVGEVDLDLPLEGRCDDFPELWIFGGERLEVGASAVRVPRMQEGVQGHGALREAFLRVCVPRTPGNFRLCLYLLTIRIIWQRIHVDERKMSILPKTYYVSSSYAIFIKTFYYFVLLTKNYSYSKGISQPPAKVFQLVNKRVLLVHRNPEKCKQSLRKCQF